MTAKVFIDGKEGTTGLQIYEKLGGRTDIELLTLPEELRKDPGARKEIMNRSDLVFLCLPDAAAIEAVTLVENPDTRIIDASTAHRTAEGWVYGFPELEPGQADKIRRSKRTANPGCHATGFISLTAPLVKGGILAADAPLSCHSLTGYSGGGKKMIAEYEGERTDERLSSCREYAISLAHKHIPEMMAVTGLKRKPLFFPIVGDYYAGMTSTVGLHNDLLGEGVTAKTVHEYLSDYYAGQEFVRVLPFGGEGAIDPRGYLESNRNVGTNYLDIVVSGNGEQTLMAAMFDNLGKGASGAAVQNMELMLGMR
ncbi:MAG: N-acetyl-gamma-glutamyl-phosphate reductase [Firmicutes bacterium]|nr:N-acetyl-gamma-glutamyl-phosphate reductase [Bacillota bacterium]